MAIRSPMPPSRSTLSGDPASARCVRPARRIRAFGDDDDAEAGAEPLALPNARGHLVEVERNLGNQHDVGAAGDARVERDPARVAAHHLDDHDAVVRLGGRVQPIDRLGRERHRRVEPERHRRLGDVVVDGLRHADDGNAALVELVRDASACRRRRSRRARRGPACGSSRRTRSE